MKTTISTAGKSARGRTSLTPPSASTRSKISNGTRILADTDHRSAPMRRYRDLIQAHVSDLGGEDAVSSAETVLIRRGAMLTLQAELMEARFAANDSEASPMQIEVYGRLCNTLRRLLESLGLERRVLDISPGGSATRHIIRAIEERAVNAP
jgi:hypothetical protein